MQTEKKWKPPMIELPMKYQKLGSNPKVEFCHVDRVKYRTNIFL